MNTPTPRTLETDQLRAQVKRLRSDRDSIDAKMKEDAN